VLERPEPSVVNGIRGSDRALPGHRRRGPAGRGARVVTRLGSAGLALWIVLGPTGAARPNPSSEGRPQNASEARRIAFEDRQSGSAVDFVLDNGTVPDKPLIDSMLGGVALFDYDNDGRLDIFFCNGARIPGLVKDDSRFWNRLYRHEKGDTFRDVTEEAGVRGEGYSMSASAADYDNDGWTDLYVTGVNRNILYHNRGDGTFADATEQAGVTGVAGGKKLWSVGAVWLDYDNDGDLDLFVANYLDWSPERNKLCGMKGKRLSCSPTVYEGLPNLLYRNDGNGRFTDVSGATGIAAQIGKGMSVSVADADGDGFTDVFVANDEMRHFLFRNEGGHAFAERGVEMGVAYTEDGVPVSGMGNDFRDLNGDGRPDIIVTDLSGESFLLYRNTAAGYFVPDIYQAGLGFATVLMGGWSIGGYDLDNDGDKDLFSANSHVSENIGFYGTHRYRQPNAVFEADAKGRFRDVTATAGVAMQRARAHRGCAFGDLDGDGRVDVVVSVIGEPPELLYNVSGGTGHWIELRLLGTRSNRDGIGAKVKLTRASGQVQYNHVTTTVGYASSSDPRVHFGLGPDPAAREIEIRWPSGVRQVLNDVAADQVLEVKEP
jgi:hypothetical protein